VQDRALASAGENRLRCRVIYILDKYLSSADEAGTEFGLMIQTKYMKNTLSKAWCFSFVIIFKINNLSKKYFL